LLFFEKHDEINREIKKIGLNIKLKIRKMHVWGNKDVRDADIQGLLLMCLVHRISNN